MNTETDNIRERMTTKTINEIWCAICGHSPQSHSTRTGRNVLCSDCNDYCGGWK